MKKRNIIVGDVHGCIDELKELLKTVEYNKNLDRLIMLGDLVDRGPDSVGCVRYIRGLEAECISGNHDFKYVRYHRHEQKKTVKKNYKNPMNLPEEKLAIYEQLSLDDLRWLETLPEFIHMKKHNMLLVHAGIAPGIHPLHQKTRTYMHCRYVDGKSGKMVKLNMEDFSAPAGSVFWTDMYSGTFDVMYGHHVADLNNPILSRNLQGAQTIGIDTGCCFGGHLTACIFEADTSKKEFVQIQAKKVYHAR